MKKHDLIIYVAEDAGITKKQAEQAVNTIAAHITVALGLGEAVEWAGLGKFALREVPERQGRKPGTNEAITISAHSKITFKPAQAFKTGAGAK